jgi:hypothetical protein
MSCPNAKLELADRLVREAIAKLPRPSELEDVVAYAMKASKGGLNPKLIVEAWCGVSRETTPGPSTVPKTPQAPSVHPSRPPPAEPEPGDPWNVP